MCVFSMAFSPQPYFVLRTFIAINLISGGPGIHVSRLRPILARGSIHPVYHEGHCVCVCVCVGGGGVGVCVCVCLPSPAPPTLLRSPDFHSPII